MEALALKAAAETALQRKAVRDFFRKFNPGSVIILPYPKDGTFPFVDGTRACCMGCLVGTSIDMGFLLRAKA